MAEMEKNNEAFEEVAEGREITFAFLLEILKKSALVMLIAAIVIGALAGVYAAFFTSPVYHGTTTFFVNNTPPTQGYISQAQTSAAISLASSCVEIANKDMVVRRAVEECGLMESLGYTDLEACVQAVKGMISADKGDSGTVLFDVTVRAASAEDAYAVLIAIQEIFPGVLRDIAGLESAKKTPMLSNPGPISSINGITVSRASVVSYVLIGAALAAVAVYAVFFIKAYYGKSKEEE